MGTSGASVVLLDAKRGEAYFQSFTAPGVASSDGLLLPIEDAAGRVPAGTTLLTSPFVDIAALARFARHAEPDDCPPEASYIRGADAKPQTKFRVARVTS